MVIFSILFLFAYPLRPYVTTRDEISAVSPRYLGGMFGIKALLAAFNVIDLLKAILVAPLRLKRGRAMLTEGNVDYSSEASLKTTQEASAVDKYRN